MCIRKPAHKLLDELNVAYDDEGSFVVVKVGRGRSKTGSDACGAQPLAQVLLLQL
jgi:ribulose 1,5-bisphosphate synthetase/thiazole synthase